MTDVKYPDGWTLRETHAGDFIAQHPKHGGGIFSRDDNSARIAVAAALIRDLMADAACALQGA